jgi:serine/threonine protein kinase/Tol biopolymer transport system component
MSLSAGTRLGPYEILAPIGKGGMGEVYRAHDTRLRRDVAIKVSAERFSERFEKEARAIASLNHPNVCTLHDVGPNYLVMELVEGQTLAERIKQGAIALDEALVLAKQITDALEAAHEKGVTHRDLKPGNIKIKTDGTVKVLDFGLAKMGGTPAAPSENSPTLTMGMTEAGVIVGTAAYMAPEQARGKQVDKRADIWAFGVVLYEMLTGQKLFKGQDLSETLAAVIKEEPKLDRVPVKVRHLLRSCLEKDPKQRLQAIGDWRLLLDEHQPQPDVRATQKLRLWQGVALLALISLGVAGWMLWLKTQPSTQISRLQVALPEKVTFQNYMSLSPDGRKLVFAATGQDGLWMRDFNSLDWRRLPGTEGAVSPFWSPDSRYLAFSVGNQLKKIEVAGGPPQTLCTVPTAFAGSGDWNREGVIVFGSSGVGLGGPLWKVSQAGGAATAITLVDASKGELYHWMPAFLPDGNHFIYVRSEAPEVEGIYAGSLDAKPEDQSRERILATPSPASYANGYLFFMRQGTLMSQPFDLGRLRLEGEPVPVAGGVDTTWFNLGVFSVSPSGALAYRESTFGGSRQLTWFDRQGKILSTFGQPGTDQEVRLSPDGTRAAVRDAPSNEPGDLWTLDFLSGRRTRFTFRQSVGADFVLRQSVGASFVWSPDGSRIAFAAGNNMDTIYEKASSGAGDEKELLKEPGTIHSPTSWSSDGRFLLYHTTNTPKTGWDVWVLPLQGDRKPVLLLGTTFNEWAARFSPDMRWIAYVSNETGRREIYVRPFVASGPSGVPALGEGKWLVSKDGGNYPKWRADGKEIVYDDFPSSSVKTVVEVKARGAVFEYGVPQQLFPGPIDFGAWDVTPDGQRFLSSAPQVQQSAVPINVVLNWPAQLKK